MKIGIFTFQRSHNYGAVLQAYALLTTLKGMGHDVELIDYWPTYRAGQYTLFNFDLKTSIKQGFGALAKNVFKELTSLAPRYIQHAKFNKFRKHNLNIGHHPLHLSSEIPDRFQVVICGSDQIWRHNFRGHEGFDEVYFAKYPLNKSVIKASYAASMGDDDIDEEVTQELAQQLRNFNFISVREESLLDIIKPLTTTVPVVVLDPVFLLSQEQWRRMVKMKPPEKKYLLFYHLLSDKQASEMAKKIAKELGLKIIEIRAVNRIANPFSPGHLKLSAGPIDFISLVANASYIVSTSYHGVLFSIIFQKPFSAMGFKSNSYRVKSVLKSLGLEQRLVQNNSDPYDQPIDYNSVNILLEEMVKKSLSFLNQIAGESLTLQEASQVQ